MSSLRKILSGPEFTQLELQAKFFRSLGDPTRLRILELLAEGEQRVNDLVKALGVHQGRVSNHLTWLKWCGLVTPTSRGRHVYYRVSDKRVREILRLARAMVADNAELIWRSTRLNP